MKKSKHGHSNNGQESWGRDSGARDLSPDLHRPHSSGTGSQMTENEGDQLQAHTSSTMRGELVELTHRLQRAEHGRHVVEQQLRETLMDRDRIHRQLESLAANSESRITEMHCVIVELSKKLKTKEDGAIAEEPEGSVSELSFQEGSIYNSDMEEVHALESQTEPLDMKLDQPDRHSANDSQMSFPNLLPVPNFLPDSSSLNRIDVLQDEVLHLRAQVALLESQLAATHTSNNNNTKDKQEPTEVPNLPVLVSHATATVVPKMAERVKLKRTTNEGEGVPDPEHLYQNTPSPDDHHQSEMKQLQRKMEYLKVQNTIMSLTLAENKQHCDHLYLLCGKYESNAVALQQALNYSDRTIEAYDVMLALFESRLDIVQNNPGGVKNKEDAENVAKHLLDHLEGETNQQSNSLGPWQDALLLYSEKSKGQISPWTKEDDFRLRSHISKLKGHRASVQSTIVTLESPFYTEFSPSHSDSGDSPTPSKRVDLETAVLMQELMNMTQELNMFKQRAEKADQEKRMSEEQLKALQEALLQLQAQMGGGCGVVGQRDRGIYSDGGEQTVEMERELVDALARESRLKARLQGLAGSVEAATKSSKEKYSQLQELKQANQNLNNSLDKCKRKYESKLKRLEQQLHDMNVRGGGGAGGGDLGSGGKVFSLPSPNRHHRGCNGGDLNNLMSCSVTMCSSSKARPAAAQHQHSVPETTL